MTRREMLEAPQVDVNAWPQRVKGAGVRTVDDCAYVPVARNNRILRTPDDPQATYDYMLAAWPDADVGSTGWFRIIEQAGPELTWEWLMVDPTKPYAALFSDELRRRVRAALKADAGHEAWRTRKAAEQTRRTPRPNVSRGCRKRCALGSASGRLCDLGSDRCAISTTTSRAERFPALPTSAFRRHSQRRAAHPSPGVLSQHLGRPHRRLMLRWPVAQRARLELHDGSAQPQSLHQRP
jgi:hypothetical protein